MAAWLFAASLLLIGLNAIGIQPLTENLSGPSRLGDIFSGVTVLCVLAAGVAGLVAILRKQERSWMVLLATAIPLTLLGMEIIDLITR